MDYAARKFKSKEKLVIESYYSPRLFTFEKIKGIIEFMTSEKKEDDKITRLEAKVSRLEKQKETYKQRCEKLKLQVLKKDELIKKLRLQLIKEGKTKEPPVKRIHRQYPELASNFALLCREWRLKTMNMRNTTMAIFRLIEPDDNGVVEFTEKDVNDYITYLRKLGKEEYLKNPTLSEYYEPYDSLVLFKHFKNIRKNLHINEGNYKFGNVMFDGEIIKPEQQTVVCSWDDLRNQKRGSAHPNDRVDITSFKGDDLVRERARRELKLSGTYDEQAVKDRIKYQADRYFGRDKITEQILSETEIAEDDDDLTINDFEEVK